MSLTNCTVRFPCFYSDTSAVLTGSDGGCLEMAAASGRWIDTILKVAKIFNVPVDVITR